MKKLQLTTPLVVPEPDGSDQTYDEAMVVVTLADDRAQVRWNLYSSATGRIYREGEVPYDYATIPAPLAADIASLLTKALNDLQNKVHARLAGTVVDS